MRRISPPRKALLLTSAALLLGCLLPEIGCAQEEVSSSIRRYRDREVSTGYYEEYEVKPRRMLPLVEVPGVSRGVFPYSPTGESVRSRARLADSHAGIKFYEMRRCDECHPQEAKDVHAVRGNITCRQCHGGEPIASINHYYSPLNPIRRHAYVCSKCHQGANASYASYIVHEPAPGDEAAKRSFPQLYYAYWFMTILIVGTLAFFIPHSLLVGLREVFAGKKKGRGSEVADDN